MKGYKTIILAVITMITGGLTGAGLLTPDMGADVSKAVETSVSSFEQMVGAVQFLIGVLIAAARAVTSTKIFSDT